MIQELTVDNLSELASLAHLFFEEGKLPGRFESEVFIRNWTQFLDSKIGVLLGLVRDGKIVGCLGGIVFPDANDGELVAIETFWYVVPECRGRAVRMLQRFEEWAKMRGAKRVMMVHLLSLNPEKVSGFYERMKYRAVEVHYLKEI